MKSEEEGTAAQKQLEELAWTARLRGVSAKFDTLSPRNHEFPFVVVYMLLVSIGNGRANDNIFLVTVAREKDIQGRKQGHE